MLSYRHSFHAGNHADVLKHTVQTIIIELLKKKETPFVYHDTHSGAGRYDLFGEYAEKTGEYKDGIALIFQDIDILKEMSTYLSVIHKMNPEGELRYYPGSPLLGRLLLRDQDRAVFSELHPTDFPLLLQEFRGDRQVKMYKEDAYSRLKASLPPKERRGLVLIDPPYELKHEYQDVLNAIGESLSRWATGIYAIWYPVVFRENVDLIIKGLKKRGVSKMLQIELGVAPDSPARGMTASGMIVINPPWTLDEKMNEILPRLQSLIAPEKGHHFVRWLSGE